MARKTKKQQLYEHIRDHGPMTASEAASALGFDYKSSVSTVGHMAKSGELIAVGVPQMRGRPRIFSTPSPDAPKKHRLHGSTSGLGGDRGSPEARAHKIKECDDYLAKISPIICKIGAPFGVLSAQLVG